MQQPPAFSPPPRPPRDGPIEQSPLPPLPVSAYPSALPPKPGAFSAQQTIHRPIVDIATEHLSKEWFFGKIPREDCERHLMDNASDEFTVFYLVRESVSAPGSYVLSWCQFNEASHKQIVVEDGKYKISSLPVVGEYNTLTQLIESVGLRNYMTNDDQVVLMVSPKNGMGY